VRKQEKEKMVVTFEWEGEKEGLTYVDLKKRRFRPFYVRSGAPLNV